MVGGFQKESLRLVRLVPYSLVKLHFTMSDLKAFGLVYFDVVDAIAERDLGYLE
jgi:hypothetical protein